MATRDSQVLRLKLSSKRLPKPIYKSVENGLHWLLGFRTFNEIYSKVPQCEPLDFSRAFLDTLGISLELSGQSPDRVPSKGPLLIVANHPFGMIEAIALDAVLGRIRPDGALMTLHWLGALPDYHGRLILVGQREKRSKRTLSVRGWRQAMEYLRNGRCVAVFPAGRVALFQWDRRSVADQPWSPHVAAVARRTGASVLPMYFHGRNGWPFQVAGAVYPPLQNIWLVRELANKRGRTLRVSLGDVIPPDRLACLLNDQEAIAFLRHQTEILAAAK